MGEHTIADSVLADFEVGTWTFAPIGPFAVAAGRYAIIPEDDYLAMTQQCDELAEALKEVADTLEVLCEGERDDPDSGIYGWDDINKRIIPLARAALAKYRQPQEAPELFPGTLDALRGLGRVKK